MSLNSNPSFPSFEFNFRTENLSSVKRHYHGTSKPKPPPVLIRLSLTTALP